MLAKLTIQESTDRRSISFTADNRVAIEEFGKAKQDWFTDLPGLENGIPSHDTLGDVFAAIETTRFSQCFSNYTDGR
ncbi:MAG: hypothetical protein CSA51_01325 [Gammaproteobacteria bacterium]|nr:MAG: hypothetical protein CSA51_01325 [Gammaproteobacteria bacterium]